MSKEAEEFITYHHNPIVAAKDRQIKELSDALKLVLNDCDHTITEQVRAQVELALAEEKANQEKIGATVQAARASASEWDYVAEAYEKGWNARAKVAHSTLKLKDNEIHALQAQRDELLAALQQIKRLGGTTAEAAIARAAIARATEGGTGQ